MIKGRDLDKALLRHRAWEFAQEWGWPLAPAELNKVCPRSNRNTRHFLKITGAGEWEMSSGARVRSIAFRCPQHGDTWEIRQVKRDSYSTWTVPYVLHNGEYVSDLNPRLDEVGNDTSH